MRSVSSCTVACLLVFALFGAGCAQGRTAAPGTASCVLTQMVLNTGVEISSPHNTLLRLKGGKRDYRVLFGPYSSARPVVGVGRGTFHNEDPIWEVAEGYAYFTGWWPIGKTRHVSAAAVGTTFAIQVDPSGVERVYLLSPVWGQKITVSLISDPTVTRLLTTESYVEFSIVGGVEQLSQPLPIPPDATTSVRMIFDYVLTKATAAEL